MGSRFIKREHSRTSAGFVGVVLEPDQVASLEGLAVHMGTSRARVVAVALRLLECACRQGGGRAAPPAPEVPLAVCAARRGVDRNADRARRRESHELGRIQREKQDAARRVCRLRLESASRVGRWP